MHNIAENKMIPIFSNRVTLWLVSLLFLTLVSSFVFVNSKTNSQPYPQSLQKVVYQDYKKLQPFNLIDHQNNTLDIEQLAGNWTFVVFGYTNCPDICPATLSQLSNLNRLVRENLEQEIQPHYLFVSVDPARDKTNSLSEYIGYFDESFIAATSDMNNLVAFEKQFNVVHRYDTPDADGNYAVTHSGEIFLIDPMVRIAAKFTPPISTQKVMQQYQDLTDYFAKVNTNT